MWRDEAKLFAVDSAAADLRAALVKSGDTRRSPDARSRRRGDRPLVVLCAGKGASAEDLAAMKLTPEQGDRVHPAHQNLCRDMATWPIRGRMAAVDGASHDIQIDRPGAVIGAVREVVGYVIAHDSTPRRR